MIWTWSDDYSVGVEELDQQHRAIFDALATLEEARPSGDAARVLACLAEVLEDARAHFAAEEEFLAAAGYPALVRQRVQHGIFLKRLRELLEGRDEISGRVVESLESWLAGHILGLDQEYAAWLRENLPRRA